MWGGGGGGRRKELYNLFGGNSWLFYFRIFVSNGEINNDVSVSRQPQRLRCHRCCLETISAWDHIYSCSVSNERHCLFIYLYYDLHFQRGNNNVRPITSASQRRCYRCCLETIRAWDHIYSCSVWNERHYLFIYLYYDLHFQRGNSNVRPITSASQRQHHRCCLETINAWDLINYFGNVFLPRVPTHPHHPHPYIPSLASPLNQPIQEHCTQSDRIRVE